MRYNTIHAKRGKKFELLTKLYLEHDPQYSTRFRNVYLWKHFPKRIGCDKGIDIMCEKRDGTWCAVQCKFFEPHIKIVEKDVSRFVKAVNKVEQESRIRITQKIFTCTTHITQPAINKLDVCDIINIDQFERSYIMWEYYPQIYLRQLVVPNIKYSKIVSKQNR